METPLERSPAPNLYQPLNYQNSIRLIQLQPGAESEPISVNLLQFELHDCPLYDAISYVWGDPSDTVPITCDSQPFQITRNLNWALMRVRDSNQALLVWADAICINQQDVRERNHQVSLMGDVYTMARSVFLAMGEAEVEGGAEDVESLVEISTNWKIQPVLPSGALPLDKRWKSVGELMDCPWFKRVWVVQEAGLAKNPVVLYGRRRFGYRDLLKVVAWGRRQRWSIGISSLLVHTEWSDWQQPTGRSLFDLINHGALLSCADPRDHFYAFLGHPLAKREIYGGYRSILVPDYTRDFRELYLKISVMFLQQIGLKVLSSVEHTENTIKESSPSWVVRWNISLVMNDIPQHRYRVSRRFPAVETPYRLCEKTLVLKGAVIDQLEECYRMDNITRQQGIEFTNIASSEILSTDSMMHRLRASRRRIYGPHTGESFLRTLSGGDLYGVSVEQRYEATSITFKDEATALCYRRCFAVTNRGYFAIVPWISQPGDVVGVVLGARVPFILRPGSNEAKYKLLGEAYVEGVMQGESDDTFEEGELVVGDIILE